MSHIVHVLPIEDIKKHKESMNCWCKPDLLDVSEEDEDPGTRVIYRHNSLDGRELIEKYGIN